LLVLRKPKISLKLLSQPTIIKFFKFLFFIFSLQLFSASCSKIKKPVKLKKNYVVKFSHFLGLYKLTAPTHPLFPRSLIPDALYKWLQRRRQNADLNGHFRFGTPAITTYPAFQTVQEDPAWVSEPEAWNNDPAWVEDPQPAAQAWRR
jgi:hypothetical protein